MVAEGRISYCSSRGGGSSSAIIVDVMARVRSKFLQRDVIMIEYRLFACNDDGMEPLSYFKQLCSNRGTPPLALCLCLCFMFPCLTDVDLF